jgi:hypothetical protein
MSPFEIDGKICISRTVDTRGADDIFPHQIAWRVQVMFAERRGEEKNNNDESLLSEE